MPDAKRNSDGLGLYLSGAASDGATQIDPDAALGGFRSSTEMRPVGALISNPIPEVIVERVSGQAGTGSATIEANGSGQLLYTAPGGTIGTAVTIADTESKLLEDTDDDFSVRVTREGTNTLRGVMILDLLLAYNNLIGQANLTSAERIAGKTTYRALMLRGHGAFGILDTSIWIGSAPNSQATIAIGLEAAAADNSIQTIANETTAPAAVSFSSPTTEGAGLSPGTIDVNRNHGLWIRRVFPASGTLSLTELVRINISFFAA